MERQQRQRCSPCEKRNKLRLGFKYTLQLVNPLKSNGIEERTIWLCGHCVRSYKSSMKHKLNGD